MLRRPIFFVILLTTASGCFNPAAYFRKVPPTEGQTRTYAAADTLLLRAAQQVLQVHDFKLEKATRERSGVLVVMGEKITTELLKAPPLSDGAVRLRIQQVEADSAQICLVWHSFYRKNFKTRIEEDKKINTAKFFSDLAMRLETLGSTVR